jgi:prevent-host-death family protein
VTTLAVSTAHKKSDIFQADREVSVAHAKAHLSAVIDSVEKRRRPVTILKRGRAVAQIIPIQIQIPSAYGSMRGTVIEVGDIVGPTGEEWTVDEE